MNKKYIYFCSNFEAAQISFSPLLCWKPPLYHCFKILSAMLCLLMNDQSTYIRVFLRDSAMLESVLIDYLQTFPLLSKFSLFCFRFGSSTVVVQGCSQQMKQIKLLVNDFFDIWYNDVKIMSGKCVVARGGVKQTLTTSASSNFTPLL